MQAVFGNAQNTLNLIAGFHLRTCSPNDNLHKVRSFRRLKCEPTCNEFGTNLR